MDEFGISLLDTIHSSSWEFDFNPPHFIVEQLEMNFPASYAFPIMKIVEITTCKEPTF